MIFSEPIYNQDIIKDETKLQALNSLAVRGLLPMFYPEKKLFCNRLKLTRQGLMREGLSPRYTLMTLAGLQKGENFGLNSPFDCRAILGNLLKNTEWLDNHGDLGLLLWTSALVAPERYEEIYSTFNVSMSLDYYHEVQEGRTMETAWFLAGLAHGALIGHHNIRGLSDLADRSFKLLKKNQGRNGIFGHLANEGGIAGALRGRLGSFADQVYPIYALSQFGSAFSHDEALQAAQICAQTICQTQGPLGQWWWHYDSQTGRVVGKYPVYSVHQDAMAPLALFALGESTGNDYSSWIFKGLEWIYGKNELNQNLCETDSNTIWRSLYLPKPVTHFKEAISLLGFGLRDATPMGLRVRFESRPYHLGWILYAFAQYGFE